MKKKDILRFLKEHWPILIATAYISAFILGFLGFLIVDPVRKQLGIITILSNPISNIGLIFESIYLSVQLFIQLCLTAKK